MGPEGPSAKADSGSPSFVPVPSAQAAESGSRLKAKWFVTEDGARYFDFNWYDSERSHDCTFMAAGDGVQRCLPTAAATTLTYRDSACTVPVFSFTNAGCGAQNGYGWAMEQLSCGITRYRVFPIGEIIDPETLYAKSGANCNSITPSKGFVYRAAGTEIPPSAFAAGTYEIDP